MDDQFSRGWLASREPVDAAARSGPLTDAVAGVLPRDRPLRILDLGTGTGSNVRYLIERLSPHQRWLLVDRDAGLLAEVAGRTSDWATSRGYRVRASEDGVLVTGEQVDCRIKTRRVEFSDVDPRLFGNRDLITGSALLDLVSDTWLHRLATVCAETGATVLFALTYNGGSHCTPTEPDDERIRDLMNGHQRRDKGFGVAAGPEAAECAARHFETVGYVVRRARSDWTLTPEMKELQARLLEGWQEAAAAMAPAESLRTRDWLKKRLEHVTAGRSQLVVCHEDLAAWPLR